MDCPSGLDIRPVRCGVIKRAVDGLFKVVTFETTLPPLKDVTVTFLTAGFLAVGVATVFAVRVLVLRVLVLRALGAVADLEAVDLTGIGIDSDVYSINIHEKTPLWGFGVTVCGLVYLSLKPPRPRHAVNGLCNCCSC